MESLEVGPPPRSPRSQQRLTIAVVAGMMAILVVIGIANLTRSDNSTPSPAPTPTTEPSAPAPTPTTAPTSPSPTPAPVRTWSTHGFLEDVDVELLLRGSDHFYLVQTKRGRVTETDIPHLDSSGSLTFVVDDGLAIIRDWSEPARGYQVRDGHPAEEVPQAVSEAEQVFPGPPGRLWLSSHSDGEPVVRLTDLVGHPVRARSGPSRIDGLENVQTDGAGGLLINSSGGVYTVTDDGPRRLTRGTVLATGPRQLLVADCDDELRCSRYLLDRRTGDRRRIGPGEPDDAGDGTVSPDGRFAALWSWSPDGQAIVRVLDLTRNKIIRTLHDSVGVNDGASLVWLPDDRLLGIRNNGLFLYDPASGHVETPDLGLSDIEQLRMRDGS